MFPAPRRARARMLAASALVLLPAVAVAQLPGAPVLQNGFANPGITLAVNGAWNSDGAAYAGAAAWAPGGARFQLSAGLGAYTPKDQSAMFAYGVRGALPMFSFMGGNLGVAPFVGIGAASGDSTSIRYIPVGAGIGYRRPVGTSLGLSAYATPFLLWSRSSIDGGASASGGPQFRTSLGLDFSFSPQIGVTLGIELGQKPKSGKPGPSSSVFGVGLSYAFR